MIGGGCFCGAIRYGIGDGDYLSVNCHCSMCRRLHAAPFVTWLVVPVERFRYLGALPAAYRSSDGGTRYRCGECGTQVACVNVAHPEIVDVAVGSLDAPGAFPPRLDAFGDTRLDWVQDVSRR